MPAETKKKTKARTKYSDMEATAGVTQTTEFEAEAGRGRRKKKGGKRKVKFMGQESASLAKSLLSQHPSLAGSVEFVTSGEVDILVAPPEAKIASYSRSADVRHSPGAALMSFSDFCAEQGIASTSSGFSIQDLVASLEAEGAMDAEEETEAETRRKGKKGSKKGGSKKRGSKKGGSKKGSKKGSRKGSKKRGSHKGRY